MKITLHDAPEGYEAEAELMLGGDVPFGSRVLLPWRGISIAITDSEYFTSRWELTKQWFIVLTPKKRKFWRLDPVATFEEASWSRNVAHGPYRLARDEHGDEVWLVQGALPERGQWLRRTEHEE